MKKELSEDEAMDYVSKYENVHKNLVSNLSLREDLCQELETNLEVICVLGLEEKLQENAALLIKQLTSSGVGAWVLSGDDYENNLGVAQQLGIVSMESDILHLKSDDPDSNNTYYYFFFNFSPCAWFFYWLFNGLINSYEIKIVLKLQIRTQLQNFKNAFGMPARTTFIKP